MAGKIESVKARLQGLIDLSNETTEREDTDLTTAVNALAEKAKKGGSANTIENAAGGLTYDIKVGEITEGGGSLEGFVKVQFYNDDRTTLLYTVYVPSGSSAIYAGETPVSTVDASMVLAGFEPAAANVTKDMDCYAVYESAIGTLDETSWEKISELSESGEAQNYFAIGDTKMIHIEGNAGVLDLNRDCYVYIIGFNHNSELEGNGVTFGTFKEVSDGKDFALLFGHTSSEKTDGTKINFNHWGAANAGGWVACDARYDILGSTDIPPSDYGSKKTISSVGYDATETCATNPVANTIMSVLPEDLRAVMKPMTIYSDNSGNANSAALATKSVDYLPLLSEFELMGVTSQAIQDEGNKQKQYEYFVAGNTKIKGNGTDRIINQTADWLLRSPYKGNKTSVCFYSSKNYMNWGPTSQGQCFAPIFRV